MNNYGKGHDPVIQSRAVQWPGVYGGLKYNHKQIQICLLNLIHHVSDCQGNSFPGSGRLPAAQFFNLTGLFKSLPLRDAVVDGNGERASPRRRRQCRRYLAIYAIIICTIIVIILILPERPHEQPIGSRFHGWCGVNHARAMIHGALAIGRRFRRSHGFQRKAKRWMIRSINGEAEYIRGVE